jgi:hypothetical protein
LLLFLFLAGCAARQPPAQPVLATEPAPVMTEPTPDPVATQPVAETAPAVPEPVPAATPGPTTATDPVILKQGNFKKVVHETSGRVQIIRAPGGAMTLNMIGFDTMPGPGLMIVLHSGNVQAGFEVSSLTSASGNYPYNLPKDFDASKYSRVSIYNKKYNVIYGEATLS